LQARLTFCSIHQAAAPILLPVLNCHLLRIIKIPFTTTIIRRRLTSNFRLLHVIANRIFSLVHRYYVYYVIIDIYFGVIWFSYKLCKMCLSILFLCSFEFSCAILI
jgi:hypothetical protein